MESRLYIGTLLGMRLQVKRIRESLCESQKFELRHKFASLEDSIKSLIDDYNLCTFGSCDELGALSGLRGGVDDNADVEVSFDTY